MKKRLAGVSASFTVILLAVVLALLIGIEPPLTHILGGFAAVTAVAVVTHFIKVSDGIYFSTLVFVFLASPMGSVLNLYRTFGPYDKIVHFMSGILLAIYGMALIKKLMSKYDAENMHLYMIPMVFTACMFSSGAAGIWEIFEFLADKLAGEGMQRGMVDTVTDMIAGNLGALVYGIWTWLRIRRGNCSRGDHRSK